MQCSCRWRLHRSMRLRASSGLSPGCPGCWSSRSLNQSCCAERVCPYKPSPMIGACSTLAQAFRSWCFRPAKILMLGKIFTNTILSGGAQKDSVFYA